MVEMLPARSSPRGDSILLVAAMPAAWLLQPPWRRIACPRLQGRSHLRAILGRELEIGRANRC